MDRNFHNTRPLYTFRWPAPSINLSNSIHFSEKFFCSTNLPLVSTYYALTVYSISSVPSINSVAWEEKIIWSWELNMGSLGEKRKQYLCALHAPFLLLWASEPQINLLRTFFGSRACHIPVVDSFDHRYIKLWTVHYHYKQCTVFD